MGGSFAPSAQHCYVENVREMWIKRRLLDLNGVDGAALLRLVVGDEQTLQMQLEALLTERDISVSPSSTDNKTESAEFENQINGAIGFNVNGATTSAVHPELAALGVHFDDIRNL